MRGACRGERGVKRKPLSALLAFYKVGSHLAENKHTDPGIHACELIALVVSEMFSYPHISDTTYRLLLTLS